MILNIPMALSTDCMPRFGRIKLSITLIWAAICKTPDMIYCRIGIKRRKVAYCFMCRYPIISG